MESPKMFITVRYGDDREQIFNPNCLVKILLQAIKDKCQCERNDILELSDPEGVVKNLHSNLTEYGTEFLSERETLILLRVEKADNENEEERPLYIPLLDGMDEDEEFIRKLNPNPAPLPSSRTSRRLSRPRGSIASDSDDFKKAKKASSTKTGTKPAKKSTPRGSISNQGKKT